MNYYRDLCIIYLNETNTGKIGGNNLTVEIDESKIFKNKNNIGRLSRGQEECEWVFGGICRETKDTFFVIVQNRTEQTLLRCIQENIELGTKIISDCWRSYRNLSEYGYEHETINHSQNFLSPEDATIHTQTIERCWRDLKQNIPLGSPYDSRDSYLYVYSFKKRTNWYNISIGERFNLLLLLIS